MAQTMLLAEDSETLGSLYERVFRDFNIIWAKGGEEAMAAIEGSEGFDICVMDVIMPVENTSLSLADADDTGLRLIERLVDQKKCSRFLVLTVRWGLEGTVQKLLEGRGTWRILLKQEADEDEMLGAVRELMATGSQERRPTRKGTRDLLSSSYEDLRAAIGKGSSGEKEASAFLSAIEYVLKDFGPLMDPALGADLALLARIYATMNIHLATHQEKDIATVAKRVSESIEKLARERKLFR